MAAHDEKKHQRRVAKVLTIYFASFFLFSTLLVASGAAYTYSTQSPIQTSGLIFQPTSVQQVTKLGNVEKTFEGSGMIGGYDGSSTSGEVHVDILNSGLDVENVWQEDVGSNYILYGIEGTFEVPLNFYTVTRSTQIASSETKSATWLSYVKYNKEYFGDYWLHDGYQSVVYDTSAGIFTTCPYKVGDIINLPSGTKVNKVGAQNFQYVKQGLYWNAYTRVIPSTASFTYTDYSLLPITTPYGTYTPDIRDQLTYGINEYQNLKVNVGYSNPAPITLEDSENNAVKIEFSPVSWQLQGVYPTSKAAIDNLGNYDVEFINTGKESGSLQVYSYDNYMNERRDQFSFMLQSEIASAYINDVASKAGWRADAQQLNIGVQSQQSDIMAPTANVDLLKYAGVPAENTVAELSLGYHIRPEVLRYKQTITYTPEAYCNFRERDATAWPFSPQPGVDDLTIGAEDTIDRTTYIKAQDYYIQQTWKVKMVFYSLMELTGIEATAVTSLPQWQQGNMIIDTTINGETDYIESLAHQAGWGDFIRDVGNWLEDAFGTLTGWGWSIIWIVVAILILYIAFKVVKGRNFGSSSGSSGQVSAGDTPYPVRSSSGVNWKKWLIIAAIVLIIIAILILIF